MKPVILRTPEELKTWRQSVAGRSVGFVPTMGALHQGHESLLKKSRAENDFSVLSIFVNPTQFNDKKDFEKYPITWDADLAVAERAGVDVVWHPNFDLMYPDHYRYKLSENDFSLRLCGKDRPGHFDGVLTIVLKLLNVVQPTRAYFGEKDHQQLTLIKGMVESLFLPYQIVPVPTLREQDGLAMSSRNVRLTAAERKIAPFIYQSLQESKTATEAASHIEKFENGVMKVDYIEDFEGRRYAAVKLGEVRLIDNIQI